MAVLHIVHKDDPRFAVRTVRNRRAADLLLLHLGPEYEITEDACTDVRVSKAVDVFTEHGYNMSKQLRNGNADLG
jgi:hypothetical protein